MACNVHAAGQFHDSGFCMCHCFLPGNDVTGVRHAGPFGEFKSRSNDGAGRPYIHEMTEQSRRK